ncbi:family 20 glycosylhydrolase [Streptomyces sp. Je 1-4]|uniref:beta-N-acetylhexosaminidase n=1 Tax=Streptomyces TaxID=1883 RepID=UPI0021D7E593|nr:MULTISPECIES: glycoside hydrolase family 20 protein [unclassified Streptomyces]UYB40349.1 family 20 glycosylhydrolase [Streptomyces sp. Je 1-4]UZQ36461.1 family 20 glycosylhydrolase [Streptomyces sp. Je 1-4] [Streptomyces sp. Je 1-4 4N24]UZQ43879.1 family 20 glycosylhydrolase [Streptomyces sp. Je 1-4] [Streptomyces sp. Je 1-4 4N24_ara]
MSNPMRPPRAPRPSASPRPVTRPMTGKGPAARSALPAAALAGALLLAGCSDAADTEPPGSTSAKMNPTSAATPTWAPVTGTPQVIPAVRDFRRADGPGWRPTEGARVVVPAGEKSNVADEAQRMARDLGGLTVVYGDQTVRPGDIEVKLTGKNGADQANNVPVQGAADEAYTLTAEGTRLTLTAPTDAGIFYGTRTVKQAVRAAGGLPEGTIQDRPGRPQRGMSLDNARKPFTQDWIEARLREIADLKLNQFQLHFSDDQGFRIQSDTHPEVVSADHLTKAQIRQIIALARSLHISVIPELDSPGHLGAVLKSHPDLLLRRASGSVVPGAIDISNPKAAPLIDSLLKEMSELFTNPKGAPAYWHLGGDEYQALLSSTPSTTYPQLTRAARQKYGPNGTLEDLATGWLNDRQKTVEAKGKNRIEAWNDGFFSSPRVSADKNRMVDYWTGKEAGHRDPSGFLREGRNVMNFNDEYLYYVLGEPNQFVYPTGQRIYESWTPLVIRGTGAVAVPASMTGPDRIPGARFAIWCDRAQAQTAPQVAAGIRLPLAALAQKTWDPRTPALSWTGFKALANRV